MSLPEDLGAMLQCLLPEFCPRCGVTSARGFCTQCRADFEIIGAPCDRCALPGPCRDCPAESGRWEVDAVRVPFAYAPPLDAFLQMLKYARQRHLGVVLGRLLASGLRDSSIGVDAVVPVPLHPRRLRERHFNQADEIARPVARSLGVPVLPALVVRSRHTPPQAELGRHQRMRSVRHAFRATRPLDRLRIAIVDDVVTTGATINAMAAALKAVGASLVHALAVARALDGPAPADHPVRNR